MRTDRYRFRWEPPRTCWDEKLILGENSGQSYLACKVHVLCRRTWMNVGRSRSGKLYVSITQGQKTTNFGNTLASVEPLRLHRAVANADDEDGAAAQTDEAAQAVCINAELPPPLLLLVLCTIRRWLKTLERG